MVVCGGLWWSVVIRQTPHTDRHTMTAYTALSIASRGKNEKKLKTKKLNNLRSTGSSEKTVESVPRKKRVYGGSDFVDEKTGFMPGVKDREL